MNYEVSVFERNEKKLAPQFCCNKYFLYTYDATGNVIYETNDKCGSIKYTYTAIGKVQTKRDSVSDLTITYTYDVVQ